MEYNLDDLLKENEKLKAELEGVKLIVLEIEKNSDSLQSKKEVETQKATKAALHAKELETQVATWQKVVDEMAHSINTDVYVAVSNLDKHTDLPKVKKAFYHVKQIRDLTNLLMWYIKRKELPISGEVSAINIGEIISSQIETIKEGISTLRLSTREHQENILKMILPIEIEGAVTINITTEISDSIGLILKDILRNALKNTKEEHPEVKIKVTDKETSVLVEVQNNRAIPEAFSQWFNNEASIEPVDISKSAKVGLRVIKMWIDLLKIDAKLLPDYQNNLTTTRIFFPKEIRYANN